MTSRRKGRTSSITDLNLMVGGKTHPDLPYNGDMDRIVDRVISSEKAALIEVSPGRNILIMDADAAAAVSASAEGAAALWNYIELFLASIRRTENGTDKE